MGAEWRRWRRWKKSAIEREGAVEIEFRSNMPGEEGRVKGRSWTCGERKR